MTAGATAADHRPGAAPQAIGSRPGGGGAGGPGRAPAARHAGGSWLAGPGIPPAAAGFGGAETAHGPRALADEG